jgi:hypothetical protein
VAGTYSVAKHPARKTQEPDRITTQMSESFKISVLAVLESRDTHYPDYAICNSAVCLNL